MAPTLLSRSGKGTLNRILEGGGLLVSRCPSKPWAKVPHMPSQPLRLPRLHLGPKPSEKSAQGAIPADGQVLGSCG